jgi:hypothetical protein
MTQTLPSTELPAAAVVSPRPTEAGTPAAPGWTADGPDSIPDGPDSIRSERALQSPVVPQATIDASIVVPYYNPGDRLRPTVDHLVQVLTASGLTYEIIAVSDGSTDGSSHTLEGLPEGLVRRVSYASNVGKGHAIRTGLGLGRGRYLGFIDADGDISPDFLGSFLSTMESEEYDIIIGSKRHEGSSVRSGPLRRFYSMGHQRMNRLLFRLNVRDTQVGIKLLHRQVVDDPRGSSKRRFALRSDRAARFHPGRPGVCSPIRSESSCVSRFATSTTGQSRPGGAPVLRRRPGISPRPHPHRSPPHRSLHDAAAPSGGVTRWRVRSRRRGLECFAERQGDIDLSCLTSG